VGLRRLPAGRRGARDGARRAAACAACGASGWDEALLGPDHPGEGEHRAVVCRRCGHEVAMGVWYGGVGQPMDPQPPADWWRERVDTMRWVFAEARFPVYGLATWEGERCWTGHGTSLGRVTDVSLGFGGRPGVVVDTSSVGAPDSHERELERKLLELATPRITAAAWQRLSPAALTVLMEQDLLRAGARVAAVVAREHAIRVDGRPESFLTGRCGDGWAAVATLEDVTVTITAYQVAPEAVALERVTDVEPYVQPPRG